jgi:protein transport protein SEC61 subunit alpha
MDPLYWLRIVFASKKGTLMELGMSPILISTMLLHTLAGKKLIEVNMGNKIDRELFQAAQKLFGFLFTLMFAVCGLVSGMYGPIENLGLVSSILIVLQLLFAGGIILLLDELLQKGYGLGNGINLFIATNIFGMILWESFSPSSIMSPEGAPEFEGAVVFFLHALFIRPNKGQGLTDALMRSYGPNLLNLVSTLIVILAVNYFQVSY